MELKTCEFCGTEYDESQGKCPLCGKTAEAAAAAAAAEKPRTRLASSKDGARVAPKGKKAKGGKPVNRGPWMAACIVLGVLVLVGLGAFLYVMGVFGNFTMDTEEETVISNVEETVQPEVEIQVEEPVQEEEEATDGACTGLTISPTQVILKEADDKVFLTALAQPLDCVEPIIYESTDEEIITVNENGMITAVGPGEAMIVVSCGEVFVTCQVLCDFEIVEEPEEEEPQPEEEEEPEEEEPTVPPTLNTEDFTLFYPGEEAYLTVNDAPEGAAISYVSSNASVVTVTNEGKVTAVGDGDATITVTVGDVKLTCIARCRLDSTTEGGNTGAYTGPFSLTSTDVTLFSSGESFTLNLLDANGNKVNVGWFASNNCVSIAGNTIKAVSSGQCTVSCVYNGVTYSCIVRCGF